MQDLQNKSVPTNNDRIKKNISTKSDSMKKEEKIDNIRVFGINCMTPEQRRKGKEQSISERKRFLPPMNKDKHMLELISNDIEDELKNFRNTKAKKGNVIIKRLEVVEDYAITFDIKMNVKRIKKD